MRAEKTTVAALLLALAGGLLTGSAVAADPVIGYVDMQRLLDSAPQIMAARSRLEAEFEPVNDDVLELEAQLSRAEERQLRDRAILGNEDAEALDREIRTLRRDLRRKREDARDELTFRMQKELEAIEDDINNVVKAFAKERGYDLLIQSPVVYVDDRIDITDEVLERLRREYQDRPAARR